MASLVIPRPWYSSARLLRASICNSSSARYSQVLCARPFEVAKVLVAERESEVIDAGAWTRDPGSGIRDSGPGTRAPRFGIRDSGFGSRGSKVGTRSRSRRRGDRRRFVYPRNDDRRLNRLSGNRLSRCARVESKIHPHAQQHDQGCEPDQFEPVIALTRDRGNGGRQAESCGNAASRRLGRRFTPASVAGRRGSRSCDHHRLMTACRGGTGCATTAFPATAEIESFGRDLD